ncbi:hypothetical protein BV911_17485 [Pseudoruegeria sp. SK021]|nr:hypothetical protein BV911_17485 [Pseudoruegeria sp. SK021]
MAENYQDRPEQIKQASCLQSWGDVRWFAGLTRSTDSAPQATRPCKNCMAALLCTCSISANFKSFDWVSSSLTQLLFLVIWRHSPPPGMPPFFCPVEIGPAALAATLQENRAKSLRPRRPRLRPL